MSNFLFVELRDLSGISHDARPYPLEKTRLEPDDIRYLIPALPCGLLIRL